METQNSEMKKTIETMKVSMKELQEKHDTLQKENETLKKEAASEELDNRKMLNNTNRAKREASNSKSRVEQLTIDNKKLVVETTQQKKQITILETKNKELTQQVSELRKQENRNDNQDSRNDGQDLKMTEHMKEILSLKKENESLKKQSTINQSLDLSQAKTINQLMTEQQKTGSNVKISQEKLNRLMTKQATHTTMLDAMLGTKRLNEELQTKLKLSNARITGIEATNKQLSIRVEELIKVLEGMNQRIRNTPKESNLVNYMSDLKSKSEELSELCSTICKKHKPKKINAGVPLGKKTHKKKKKKTKVVKRNNPKGKDKTKKRKAKGK